MAGGDNAGGPEHWDVCGNLHDDGHLGGRGLHQRHGRGRLQLWADMVPGALRLRPQPHVRYVVNNRCNL